MLRWRVFDRLVLILGRRITFLREALADAELYAFRNNNGVSEQ